jgi:carboxylesterase
MCDDFSTVMSSEENFVPLLPGAEPFHHDGGSVGALLCHGFTGSPQSLRPWANYLAEHDYTVSLPRLPGHGTRWQDMQLTRWDDWYSELDRALTALLERCEDVFVMGLSMGGALALRLAEQRSADVAGIVLVNPYVVNVRRSFKLLPVLKLLTPTAKGVAGDIKKANTIEVGYDRVPLRALASLVENVDKTRADLGRITSPLLIFRSSIDHVVEPDSCRELLAHVGTSEVEELVLEDCYHVATLDNEAETIFAGSVDFMRRHRTSDDAESRSGGGEEEVNRHGRSTVVSDG